MRHSLKLVATSAVCATMLAGSAALAAGASAPHGAPGVSAHQVTVGAIVSQSGGLQADFAPYLSGVNAYFDWVNAKGGINGRHLVLPSQDALDDQSNGNTDIQDAQTLVTTDHVFAVVGVSTPFFDAHSYLAGTSTPVFGYATANVWAGPKTFFADYGSTLNYNSSIPDFAFVAHKAKVTKIAVVALSYPSSKDECQGAIKGLVKYHYKVVYSNVNESVLQNWQIQANNIRQSGAAMVVTCMDVNSSIALSKAMAAYHLKPVQLWLDGYDRSVLSKNSQYMQDVYFLLQHVPFEGAAVYPHTYPGLNLYLQQMVAHGFASNEYSDVALMGWESAALFAQGLQRSGSQPDAGVDHRSAQQDQEGHGWSRGRRRRADELDDRAHEEHVAGVRDVRRRGERHELQARVQPGLGPVGVLPADGPEPGPPRQPACRDTGGIASGRWPSSSAMS